MNSTPNDKMVYADEWNVSSQYFYKNEYYSWMADNLTGHKKVLDARAKANKKAWDSLAMPVN